METPVFTKKSDNQGRQYLTAYANIKTNCVISVGQKNIIVPGNPNINMRIGASKFGQEIFIGLYHHKDYGGIEITEKRTGNDSIEIYFPKELGLNFFKQAIAFLESEGANQ